MIHHVWGLFTHPGQEWNEIRGEEETVSHMYLTHVLLLAAIPAVSAYIGATQVGWSIGGGEPVKLTQASCMQLAILSYFAMLAGVAVRAVSSTGWRAPTTPTRRLRSASYSPRTPRHRCSSAGSPASTRTCGSGCWWAPRRSVHGLPALRWLAEVHEHPGRRGFHVLQLGACRGAGGACGHHRAVGHHLGHGHRPGLRALSRCA